MLDFIFAVGVVLSILVLLFGAYLSICGTICAPESAGEDQKLNQVPATELPAYRQGASSVLAQEAASR